MITETTPLPREHAEAVEDVLETVEELRRVSASALELPLGSDARWKEEQRAKELTSRVALRAERAGLTTDRLLELANGRITLDERHGRIARERRVA